MSRQSLVVGRWSLAVGLSFERGLLIFANDQRTSDQRRPKWYVQNSVNGPYDKSNLWLVYVS